MINSTITVSYNNSVFSWERNCQTISQSGCAILHSPVTCEWSSFSASLPTFDIFHVSYSDRSVMISYCGFNLYFCWLLVLNTWVSFFFLRFFFSLRFLDTILIKDLQRNRISRIWERGREAFSLLEGIGYASVGLASVKSIGQSAGCRFR